VRTAEFTAGDGFHLNGRRVQLRGVNLHHDHGPLGAVFLPRAMERQIEVMQEMGVNSIRTSHNMPAPELLELCDRMGILVMAEAFDKWDETADFLPGGDLEEFAERQLGNFLRRDRNHPSVVLWSVGNEVWDVLANEDGTANARLHLMTHKARKYDPSRPVTFVTSGEHSLRWRQFQYFDVHAWNYRRQYALAHALEPRKAALAAESGSTVSTRGYYELPLPKDKTDHHLGGLRQVSSYDLLANQWTDLPDHTFHWLEEDRYAAGEYVWTGFDYLGEPVPYGWYALQQERITPREAGRSSYFGIVDLVGIPKDRYYLYRSYWAPEKTTVHLLPHWNWEGSGHATIPVFLYTNGDSAELFLNGKSQGVRRKNPTSQNPLEHYRLMWMEVPWEPGELRAVAFREGKEIGEAVVATAGEPAALKLTPDRTELTADGDDLAYVLVESFDGEGRPSPLADNRVDFDVTGPARIAGVGNGNPQSLEPFVAGHRKLFYGKAMLILRTEAGEAGEIRVRATSRSLSPATASMVSRLTESR
jgi:beta-galactosidase